MRVLHLSSFYFIHMCDLWSFIEMGLVHFALTRIKIIQKSISMLEFSYASIFPFLYLLTNFIINIILFWCQPPYKWELCIFKIDYNFKSTVVIV